MLTIPHNPLLSTISAIGHEGLSVTAPDDQPARLAIIDADGNVIDAGPDVAAAAWNVTIKCFQNFMIGRGYMKVWSAPGVHVADFNLPAGSIPSSGWQGAD